MPASEADRLWNEDAARAVIAAVVSAHGARQSALLPLLHGLQERFGYIDARAIPLAAKALNISRADVHGVISFYSDFRAEPPGRHRLALCQAEACQSLGARALTARACASLGLGLGETSQDGAVSLDAVYCLGHCAAAPAAMIDGRSVARLDVAKLDAILERIKQ